MSYFGPCFLRHDQTSLELVGDRREVLGALVMKSLFCLEFSLKVAPHPHPLCQEIRNAVYNQLKNHWQVPPLSLTGAAQA